MNHKEVLFFIGKCLTISHDKENREFISNKIQSEDINWDSVVKMSTSHYVFPALYHNLSRADLLSFLPEDLVAYMKHISDLNRDRNLEIVEQAKEINQLLIKNGIIPIFLKGTGFLLIDHYQDISERMLSDIDFLVSEKDFKKTIQLLKEDSYAEKDSLDRTFVNRHYTALIHPKRIAAVEVHHSMTSNPYRNHFNYKTVSNSFISKDSISTLSPENQLLLTIFNKQVNDYGQWYKTPSLRSVYDVFILAVNINTLEAIQNFKVHFDILNNFLASAQWVLGTQKIMAQKNESSKRFIKQQLYFLNNPKKEKKNRKKWNRIILIRSKLNIFTKLFYDKRAWKYVLQRTSK